MPQKVDVEVALFEKGSGKRSYGKIPWAQFADGETWRFDKDPDWLNVKTGGQVVDMAERFAKREGYTLSSRHEGDSVWIKLVKIEPETQPETADATA